MQILDMELNFQNLTFKFVDRKDYMATSKRQYDVIAREVENAETVSEDRVILKLF